MISNLLGRPKNNLNGKLVVITGGGSGIGRETALAFAAQGATIVVSDIDLTSAEQTVELIYKAGGTAYPYQLNVADRKAIQAHAEEVADRHGVADVLINNAGIGQAASFLKTSPESFDRVMNINLFGVVDGCRAFGEQMVKRGQGGHIVNLASMAAFVPQQSFSAYSTSKAAVFMFSDCLRAEFAASDIAVSTICPGIVHTNIVTKAEFSGLSEEAAAERRKHFDQLYAKRHYTPDRVAREIVRAVQRKKAIVPVTPEAHLAYYLRRFAPALVRWMAANRNVIG